MGLYSPDQPEDEVCRAVAAEDMLLRHTLGPAQRRPQGAAAVEGVVPDKSREIRLGQQTVGGGGEAPRQLARGVVAALPPFCLLYTSRCV